MRVQRVETDAQLQEAFRIRKEVFVREQGVAEDIEIDEHESGSRHVLVYDNGEAVGTGRVRRIGDQAKLERICVLASHRDRRLGQAIMNELEVIAVEMGLKEAKLHGQTQAAGFYSKLGYVTVSEIFMEEGIPHVRMIKRLCYN